MRHRILTVPVALLLATFLGAAGTTLTTIYFPPSDSGSPLDVLMRGQFAAILAETREPVLHDAQRQHLRGPRDGLYGQRVRSRFSASSGRRTGVVMSTIRNFGFSDLGVPIERSVVEKPIPGAAFTRLLDEIQRQNFFTMASTGTVATVDAPVCLIEVFDGRAYPLRVPRAMPAQHAVRRGRDARHRDRRRRVVRELSAATSRGRRCARPRRDRDLFRSRTRRS